MCPYLLFSETVFDISSASTPLCLLLIAYYTYMRVCLGFSNGSSGTRFRVHCGRQLDNSMAIQKLWTCNQLDRWQIG
jgi:hypothetical protein